MTATSAGGFDAEFAASVPVGVLDAMPAVVAVIDPAGDIIAINERWRRFADENGGRDPDYFLGWNYFAQCDRARGGRDEEGAQAAAHGLREILAGRVSGFQHVYPCDAPNTPRWMRLRARGFKDAGRRLAAVVHEDISARVRAEKARDRQHALYRAVFDSALDGIVTIDEKGIITAVNPAIERLFGYTTAELVGRNVSMLMAEPDRSRHDLHLQQYRQAGAARVIGIGREVEGQRRDGKRIPLLLQISEAHVDSERLFTGVLHDLTERKEAEAARLEQERRDLIVRELGHRIKNVFAVVLSVAHILRRTTSNVGEYHEALASRLRSLAATQMLLTEGARQGVMLDELLAFEFAAYAGAERAIDASGDPVRLSAEAAQLLGMAIHELATNSSKYGALSATHGRLQVKWRIRGRGTDRHLSIVWTERGGPPVVLPLRKGFGSTLIERTLRAGLGATVELDYRATGLICRLDVPLDRIVAHRLGGK